MEQTISGLAEDIRHWYPSGQFLLSLHVLAYIDLSNKWQFGPLLHYHQKLYREERLQVFKGLSNICQKLFKDLKTALVLLISALVSISNTESLATLTPFD